MSGVYSAVFALLFIIFGVIKVTEYKKSASAVDEVCRFIIFVKNNIRYKNSTYEMLLSEAENENFKYIEISKNNAVLNKAAGNDALNEYKSFLSKLGTSDTESQLNLCDEYCERFEIIRKNKFEVLPSKIKVCTALSALSALCILIIGG